MSKLAFSTGRFFLAFCQKDKMNTPQPDKYKTLLHLRRLQQAQVNTRKKQPQETNRTWPLIGRRTCGEQKWVMVSWRRNFTARLPNQLQ